MTMLKSMFHSLLYRAQPFVWMSLLTYVILFIVRLLEIVLVTSSHAEMEISAGMIIPMVIYDALFYFLFVAISAPVYFFLQRYSQQWAVRVYMVLISILIFTSLGSVVYFSVTMVPLSVDLFGYSMSDIHETVVSSGGAGIEYSAYVIGVLVLLGTVPYFSKKLPTPRWLASIVFGGVLISIPMTFIVPKDSTDFNSETEFYFSLNKAQYFFDRSIVYAYNSIIRSESSFAQEYPFLKKYQRNDVLGPFFADGTAPPNLVFIIVEGLGSSFLNDNDYSGFMPFIDSLAGQSLFWENFLSTTGRTFGVLPSLFGSLPFGEKGFMELGHEMPDHTTLISILKRNGYVTSFFYGGRSGFDMQDLFLERQRIDNIVDDQFFPPPYEKAEASMSGYSWGYADRDLFKRSLEILSEENRSPRLDIYLTLSTHEPFIPPQKDRYRAGFMERLNALNLDDIKKRKYLQYADIFSTLLYTDDAIRFFLSEYRKRPDYHNTIFIITGDHRLIPIPMSTKIDRYRVPFIVYSPMLKQHKKISSVSTHSNVVPSLTSFLEGRYSLKMPEYVHWIADGLDTASAYRNIHSQPLMRNKNELIDYLDGQYFYSDGTIFRIFDGLDIDVFDNDSIKHSLEQKLSDFKKINDYVCRNNKLYPYRQQLTAAPEKGDDIAVYKTLGVDLLTTEEKFRKAQEYAFAGRFIEARAICRKLLSTGPNYHDVRTLLGRTYAWDHNYDTAREIFTDVQSRAPMYADAYMANAQVEFWSYNFDNALTYINKALSIDTLSVEGHVLKSKILYSLNNVADAGLEIDRALTIDPSYREAIEWKRKLIQ